MGQHRAKELYVVVGGPRSKVHAAYVTAEAAEGYAVSLYVTRCGMYSQTLGDWMRQVDEPITCRTCLKRAQT